MKMMNQRSLIKGLSFALISLCLLLCFLPGQRVEASVIIDKVEIQVPSLTVGKYVAAMDASTTTPNVVIIDTTWHERIDDDTTRVMSRDQVFKQGSYILVARVEPITGYSFSAVPTVTINGGTHSGFKGLNAKRITPSMNYNLTSSHALVEKIINVSLSSPTVGQKASELKATSPTLGVNVEKTTWYSLSGASSTAMTDNQTFGNGQYYAQVRLTPSSGFGFEETLRVFISGQEVASADYTTKTTSLVEAKSKNFTLKTDIIISKVDFLVSAPAIGQKASDVKATATTAGVNITDTTWFLQLGRTWNAVAASHVFGEGNYRSEVTFELASDHVFLASLETIPYSFNATDLGKILLRGASALKATSPVFALSLNKTTINRIDIQLPSPVIGQKASEAKGTVSSEGILEISYSWHHKINGKGEPMLLTDVFSEGETYYCQLYFSAHENYKFASDAKVYIDGIEGTNVKVSYEIVLSADSKDFELKSTTEKKLISISKLTDIKDIANGSAKTVTALKLPSQVAIVTNDGNQNANISWHLSSISYDPNKKEAQTFGVNGTVTLPDGVSNPSEISLEVQVSVTVLSVEESSEKTLKSIITPDPISGIANGTAKTETNLKLPALVTLVTDSGNESGGVTWSLSGSSYDPYKKEAQTFVVDGNVSLPAGVSNPDKLSLTVQVSITVQSAEETAKAEEVSVRYQANGGIGSAPSAAIIKYGESYNVLKNMFTRSGYVFTGWRTSPNGGTFYEAGDSIKVTSHVVLYAQWITEADAKDQVVTSPSIPDEPIKPVEKVEETTIIFTIDSKIVFKNGKALPALDVPAMIINGRTMIPFRYFIETALGGKADFDAESYMIIATLGDHEIVMIIEDTTIYVDGVAIEMSQAPTIVDSRTLVPLRLVETIAKSVGWNADTRQATIVLN